jgi:hypothetical protein
MPKVFKGIVDGRNTGFGQFVIDVVVHYGGKIHGATMKAIFS